MEQLSQRLTRAGELCAAGHLSSEWLQRQRAATLDSASKLEAVVRYLGSLEKTLGELPADGTEERLGAWEGAFHRFTFKLMERHRLEHNLALLFVEVVREVYRAENRLAAASVAQHAAGTRR